jgi:hypothetical protein
LAEVFRRAIKHNYLKAFHKYFQKAGFDELGIFIAQGMTCRPPAARHLPNRRAI